MAVDTVPCRDTNKLAHPDKAFYPVRIPVSHWQLRHYISTPEPELLYYASGHEIFCLNTSTRKRHHIATLPFEARCTSSGYGWICVGGGQDEGHFATVKLEGGPGVEVDSALSLDAGLHWRGGSGDNGRSTGGPVGGRRRASVTVKRIGEEIVNSISIHRIQDEEAHLDDIVAVLTNNDRTVRMYSLPAGQETRVLTLKYPINHATISPDGHTLVAVGDTNCAFFFRRKITAPIPQIHKPHNRLTSASIDWIETRMVPLHKSEIASTEGYFTTAWSPSGHLVAVGSEGGYITVFDVDMLARPNYEDAATIVAVVPGSRPDNNVHSGAVRSMMFSPEPWDLLIWAEDQGRIGIGDLRTGLKSRQVINLEPKDETLHRLDYEDAAFPDTFVRDLDDLELDYLRHSRQAPDSVSSSLNFATEYIESRRRTQAQRQNEVSNSGPRNTTTAAASAAAPSQPGTSSSYDEFFAGISAEEMEILESFRLGRQREEAAARAAGTTPRSVNYTTADMFRFRNARDRLAARLLGDSELVSRSTQPISEILSSIADPTFPELSRTHAASPRPSSRRGPGDQNDADTALPSFSTLQSGGWGSNMASGAQRGGHSWLTRPSDASRLPRRRASVVITPPTTNSSPASTSTVGNGPSNSNVNARAEAEENPWRTIEEHMALGLPSSQSQSQSHSQGPLFESAARARAAPPFPAEAPASPSPSDPEAQLQAQIQAELAAERVRARSLQRQRERWRSVHSNDQRLPGLIAQGGDLLLRRSQLRSGYGNREAGVRTAGLAMSPDGRVLWAACEEGIFEIQMDVKSRLFYPAIEPR